MPPGHLSMRDPQSLEPSNPQDKLQIGENSFNKLEENRLKNPVKPPSPPQGNPTNCITYGVDFPEVFRKIESRMANFSPPIRLSQHVVHSQDKVNYLWENNYALLITHRNTLDGIDFIVEDRNSFLCAIRNAKADVNQPAFVEGSKFDWKKHWALALSFQATDGIGFREIFRPVISDRPIENNNRMGFDARFGRNVNVDISALHIALAQFDELKNTRCNIHIDNLTVTLGGLTNDVGISPSVINHLVNELLFKTKLEGKLPDWMIDDFNISLLNPDEGFLRAGIGLTIINNPNFKWAINYSAGLNNNSHIEWSGSFKFDHSVTMGITAVF